MQAITWLRPEVLGRIAIAAELERDEVVFLVVGGVGIRVPVGGDACALEVVRVRRRGADRLTVGADTVARVAGLTDGRLDRVLGHVNRICRTWRAGGVGKAISATALSALRRYRVRHRRGFRGRGSRAACRR